MNHRRQAKYTATLSSYEFVYIDNATGQPCNPSEFERLADGFNGQPCKYSFVQIYTKAATIQGNTLRELDIKAWQLNESMKLNGNIEVYIHYK